MRWERELHLPWRQREGLKREHGEDFTVKEGFKEESKSMQRKPRISRRKHERASGHKSSPGRSAVLLQIWPNLKWKRLGDEGSAHKLIG